MSGFADDSLREILGATWPGVASAFDDVQQNLCVILTSAIAFHSHMCRVFDNVRDVGDLTVGVAFV